MVCCSRFSQEYIYPRQETWRPIMQAIRVPPGNMSNKSYVSGILSPTKYLGGLGDLSDSWKCFNSPRFGPRFCFRFSSGSSGGSDTKNVLYAHRRRRILAASKSYVENNGSGYLAGIKLGDSWRTQASAGIKVAASRESSRICMT